MDGCSSLERTVAQHLNGRADFKLAIFTDCSPEAQHLFWQGICMTLGRKVKTMKRNMAIGLLALMFLIGMPASTLAQLSLDVLGQKANEVLGTNFGSTMGTTVGSAIPAATIVRYNAKAGGLNKQIYPSNKAATFDLHTDSHTFKNFKAVSPYGVFRAGTCYGVSFLVYLWYSRITRPMRLGRDPEPYRHYPLQASDLTLAERIFGMPLDRRINAVATEADGVNYLITKLGELHGDDKYTAAAIKANPSKYGLRAVCGNISQTFLEKAAICHQDDYKVFKTNYINTGDPYTTSQWINKLSWRLENDGATELTMVEYDKPAWNGKAKSKMCHATVLYKISEIKAEDVATKKTTKAWKLDLFDPNMNYVDANLCKDAHGYGTYLLYFPDTQKITFSKRMLEIYGGYGLQADSTFIDGVSTKIGTSEPAWSDWPTLRAAGVQRMLKAATGNGHRVD